MTIRKRRVRAIVRKELREYRRNTAIVWTMAVIPVLFILAPLIQILGLPAAASAGLVSGDPLAILLGIPALVPGTVAAYSIVGERQQGTLEPVLTTPIPREEFLLGKALAVLVPSFAISLVVYMLFLAIVELFAQPGVAAAVVNGPVILAQLVFTPLLAAWSIWVGIAISSRSSDLRVAQQLSALANLPPVVVLYLIAYNVIPVSLALAVGLGVLLLALDGLGWRMVASVFDRERLITATR